MHTPSFIECVFVIGRYFASSRALFAASLGAIALTACGSPSGAGFGSSDASTESDVIVDVADPDAGRPSKQLPGRISADRRPVSLAIEPATAALESLNGQVESQAFHAVGAYGDGTTAPASRVSWTVDHPQVGAIDATGLYTASGVRGGAVTITATSGGLKASATLLVKLLIKENSAAGGPVLDALAAATAPDPKVELSAPYDGTVFPRGIGSGPLMWDGGGPSDTTLVTLKSPAFELQAARRGWDRYIFSDTDWGAFLESTSGDAELKVARWDGTSATVVADHHWTVAPGSMRGAIYYWSMVNGVDNGRVVRILPGAAAPEDFLGSAFSHERQSENGCPSCHTVSADGQHLFMYTGNWGSAGHSVQYDLKSGLTSTHTEFDIQHPGASEWNQPGVSPDGSVVVENFAPIQGRVGHKTGAWDAVTGLAFAKTGLEHLKLGMPAFSPDGKLLAYVEVLNDTTAPGVGDLYVFDWDAADKKATNNRRLVVAVANPSMPVIQFPTVSPDHRWVVYGRGQALSSEGHIDKKGDPPIPWRGNLYAVSVDNPYAEIPLDALNGAHYPFAHGWRDRDFNFEPTFAPVAAGGHFWIVFHSRRTWGNELRGAPYPEHGRGVKQLWVAAFDQAPTPGQDPSHPAFHLPGQGTDTLNMRGYWALSPCKSDGNECKDGVDCCGGYCVSDGTGQHSVCRSSSSGCSQDGDKCAASADCCGAAVGVTCINGVCAAPPPR